MLARGEGAGTRTDCWWEKKNGTATLEHSLTVSHKTKHSLLWSSNYASWCLHKWTEMYVPHECLERMVIHLQNLITRSWKPTRYPSMGEQITCGISIQWNIIQQWKEVSYWTMRKHGGSSSAHFSMKEANLKSLHSSGGWVRRIASFKPAWAP
jgi:hypothetical protein